MNSSEKLLSHACRMVRLQAYKVMLWSADYNHVKQIVRKLKTEIKLNTVWMPFHYHGKDLS